MNFLERKAMQRATRLLSIPIGEEVLDFDIGTSGMCLLPDPFPPFGAKRIDLVCTTGAIYLHINGVSARWEWDQFLELETVLVPPIGKLLKGRFVDGGPLYVPLGTSTRMFGTLAQQNFSKWSSELTPDQQMERAEQLRVFKELDAMRKRREERIKPYRMAQPRAKGYAVERTSGEAIGHGDVVFGDEGLFFHNERGGLVAVLPYELLSNFAADQDDPSTLRASLNETDVSEVVVKTASTEEWLKVLAIYSST
jgi:hypothetical protein